MKKRSNLTVVSENENSIPSPEHAFILGAGLGTRLRPLTNDFPKPLVPVWNKPLISYAFDHLMADLGVSRFMVNTHHCPGEYSKVFLENSYRDCDLNFRHEPVLLDTAGGIDNIRDWLPQDKSFIVYNGDILTDLPLRRAWESHHENRDVATLLLRSEGDELRVGWDEASGKVVDLRGELNPDWPHRFQFTGIYILSPRFWEFIEPGKIESIVIAFLRAIQGGNRIGGIVIDEGQWSDLGERDSYLASSSMLAKDEFPRYGKIPDMVRIHPDARIDPGAEICGESAIGAGTVIGAGAVLKNSVIWEDATVDPTGFLDHCIVRNDQRVGGSFINQDF